MKFQRLNKKGQEGALSKLPIFTIGIVVAAVIIGLMANVVQTIRNSNCGTDGNVACTGNVTIDVPGYAYNASNLGLQGLNTFSTYLPTIALVLVAALIIGIIVSYFYFKGRND